MTEEYIATQEYIDEIYEKDAIGRVQMNISVKSEEVPALVRAIKSYFEGLKESPVRPEEAHEVDEVFVAGGWAYIVKWREGEVPSIILESGGRRHHFLDRDCRRKSDGGNSSGLPRRAY